MHEGMPVDYGALLPHLLTPANWAQNGSILGLVALLPAFLAHDAVETVETYQHMSVLGIVRQRLVLRKANDRWGFRLQQSVVFLVYLCVFFFDGGAGLTECVWLGLHCNHIPARSS